MLKTKLQSSAAETVRKKLDSGHQLLPFPQVVERLLTALKDPNSNAASLAKIVESDAALSVRLLRMANSPIYGSSRAIESVGRATTVLGTGPLKNIALTFAASSLFSGGAEAKHHRELVWNHSLGCATVARELAKFVQSANPDEAFLAGIFHDVGKLFFYDTMAAEYSDLDRAYEGRNLIDNETVLFETTHEQVGLKLMNAWQLPEILKIAVGYHHQPKLAIVHQEMAALIHVADALAKQGGIGSPTDQRIDASIAANEYLNLNDDAIAIVREQSREVFEETKRSCAG